MANGTAEEIARAASGVQGIADEVRHLAGSLLELASVGWESSAAAEFRRRLAAETGRVRVAADRVDDAALALRRHAWAVDRAVTELSGEVGLVGRGVVGEIGRLLGGLADIAGRPA